jgi:hypothetical protein
MGVVSSRISQFFGVILTLLDPGDGEEGEDFMDQMIDWDEWDATSIARAESSKTAD